MDYGNTKPAAAGFAGMALIWQGFSILGILFLVLMIVLLIRYLWRRGQDIDR